jgi:hypothetical protein
VFHITQVVTMICREKSVHSWLFQCGVIKFLIALIIELPHLRDVYEVSFARGAAQGLQAVASAAYGVVFWGDAYGDVACTRFG